MDEGLKSELQKQGIFTTTLEEIYNWVIQAGKSPAGITFLELGDGDIVGFSLIRSGLS